MVEPTGGHLLYRCRVCSNLDRAPHVPDLARALALIASGRPLPKSWGCTRALHDVHKCAGGSLGIADLIGGDPDGRPAAGKPEMTAAVRAKLEAGD